MAVNHGGILRCYYNIMGAVLQGKRRNSMQCVKCRAELPEGAVFCHICGRRQVAEPRRYRKRANGTGSVYKLQGRRRKPWVASKAKTIIGYYETRTAALEALERLSGRDIDERYNMTFTDVVPVAL